MLYFPFITRRLNATRPVPASCRPRLEALEDRLVLSGFPDNQSVLVASFHSSAGGDNNKNATPGIIEVNPNGSTNIAHWTQRNIAVDGQLAAGSVSFAEPSDVIEDPNHSSILYVTDYAYGGTGAVLKVTLSQTSNPTVSVVADNDSWMVSPNCLVEIGGYLYVADEGNTPHGTVPSNLVKINLTTDAITHLTNTWGVVSPVGILPVPGDSSHFYLADEGGSFGGRGFGPGKVYEFDLSGNLYQTIASGGYLTTSTTNPAWGNMDGFTLNPSTGVFYACNTGDQGYSGSVVYLYGGYQTFEAEDEDVLNPNPSLVALGDGVDGDVWDPYINRIITNGTRDPSGQATGGHLCVVDQTHPGTGIGNVQVYENSGDIATPTGMTIYTTGSLAPLPPPPLAPTGLVTFAQTVGTGQGQTTTSVNSPSNLPATPAVPAPLLPEPCQVPGAGNSFGPMANSGWSPGGTLASGAAEPAMAGAVSSFFGNAPEIFLAVPLWNDLMG